MFSLRTRLILHANRFVSLFSFVSFISSKPFLLFQLLIHIWLTAFVTSNDIYMMVFFTFCVQKFCNIDYPCLCTSLQFVTGLFLTPSLLFTYSLSMSAFWRCILYAVSIFTVPVSTFYSS